MAKQILVNSRHYETRLAVVEDGEIKSLHVEREEDRNVVGNIYKGLVKRVLPGMQAAFLELGLERTAFLYVDDIIEQPFADVEYEDESADDSDAGDINIDEEIEAEENSDNDRDPDNDQDNGTPNGNGPLPNGHGSGHDGPRLNDNDSSEREQQASPNSDEPGMRPPRAPRDHRDHRDNRDNRFRRNGRRGGRGGHRRPIGRRPKNTAQIQDLIKEGQEVLVQVAKAPIGTKGARLTTHISLPGRNVVLVPTIQHIGISRKIENDRERRRLREIFLRKIRPENVGIIIRTVAAGKQFRELKADVDYLVSLWDKIKKDNLKKRAPALIHEDLSLDLRAVRDFFTDDVDSFIVDDPKVYENTQDFIGQFMPRLKSRVKLFRGPSQLFEHYGIEAEISRALGKKVWLKSGGYLLIDQSEALTSIDVNTGRYVGSKSLEETILRTNLEAVKEIAYQLRIRDVGGIIIIDLIDMEHSENREKVFHAFREALGEDRARTNILKISELGLVEMTRKRTSEDLVRYLTEACEYCGGRGYHKSRQTICYEIFREIEKEALTKPKNIVIFANPGVVELLCGGEKEHVTQLECRLDMKIVIKPDPTFHIEQFEVFGKR